MECHIKRWGVKVWFCQENYAGRCRYISVEQTTWNRTVERVLSDRWVRLWRKTNGFHSEWVPRHRALRSFICFRSVNKVFVLGSAALCNALASCPASGSEGVCCQVHSGSRETGRVVNPVIAGKNVNRRALCWAPGFKRGEQAEFTSLLQPVPLCAMAPLARREEWSLGWGHYSWIRPRTVLRLRCERMVTF